MSESLLQLADELTAALVEFSKLQQIIQDANKRLGESPPATYDMYALGGILHDLYHGIESICSLILKRIDKHLPVGSSWHRELIDIVSRPSEITKRPAIISRAFQ